jgi:hypothetical protein
MSGYTDMRYGQHPHCKETGMLELMYTFAPPLFIFGVVWAFAGPWLAALKQLNQVRDRIVASGQKQELSRKQRDRLYWSDWFPIWSGILVANLFLTIAVAMGAYYLLAAKPYCTVVNVLCYCTAILPGVAFCGWLGGGIVDMKAMRDESDPSENRANPPPQLRSDCCHCWHLQHERQGSGKKDVGAES